MVQRHPRCNRNVEPTRRLTQSGGYARFQRHVARDLVEFRPRHFYGLLCRNAAHAARSCTGMLFRLEQASRLLGTDLPKPINSWATRVRMAFIQARPRLGARPRKFAVWLRDIAAPACFL